MTLQTHLPVLAVVSTDIRRDLVLPMRHFTQLRLRHYYRQAPYHDLAPEDLDDTLVAYRSPRELWQLLRQDRPDVIQNVELFSLRQLPYVYTIYLYARSRGIPLIAGVHISRPLKAKYGAAPALALKLLLQPVLRYTRLFFHLNDGGRRNLLWMGVPEQKLVRHMYGTWGVDPNEFTPVRDGREPDWGGGPVLLFVGRIHEEKGIFDLLEAFRRLHDDFPTLRLKLIGSGPQREHAEAYVQAQRWEEYVELLGTIKNRDLAPYYRAATVFVSPPRTTRKWEEYVGMTNIQAMSCGVPVVSTRSGAIPEYVPDGKAGVLVSEGNPVALAEAIEVVLRNRTLRERMSETARAHALRHFDADAHVSEAEQTILERCGL